MRLGELATGSPRLSASPKALLEAVRGGVSKRLLTSLCHAVSFRTLRMSSSLTSKFPHISPQRALITVEGWANLVVEPFMHSVKHMVIVLAFPNFNDGIHYVAKAYADFPLPR